jgi:5'-nucleotidase
MMGAMSTRVLITNDDGIDADGLRSLHRALSTLEEVEITVIAPDSNRSATARGITTRVPLAVEEVGFEDGSIGYATDGTPVDCVRFADLGLGGNRPDLIVSGINHGSNMGDDITYSGTVAAAFEGIVLGIPAIAVSQQSSALEMGFMPGRRFEFDVAAKLTAELVRFVARTPLRAGTLLNVNCPGSAPGGVEITRLGKRVYEDELKLVGEDPTGRTRYRIYGFAPSFEDEPGTDLSAVSRGCVSITPVHFDLTDRKGIEKLSSGGLTEALEAVLPRPDETPPGRRGGRR